MRSGLGKHAQAAGATEGLLSFSPKGWDAPRLAATLLARRVVAAESDEALAPEERQRVTRTYVYRALTLLQTAIDSGYRNLWELGTSSDFRALRWRAGFQELVNGLMTRSNEE